RWKWLLAYVLTDECYAVTITHYHQGDNAGRKHWYFFGAGLTLWATWQASTAAGILLGTQIPSSWSLDFTLPLTFIIPSVRPRPSGLGICALVLVWGLDGVLDILRRIC
ncbi:MAG: AzlC family ABC transporter permease, partial [Ktedonobacteraceae bacterium]